MYRPSQAHHAHAAWQALKDNAAYLHNSIDSRALGVALMSKDCLSDRQRTSLEVVSNPYTQSERLIGELMKNIAEGNDASILDRTIVVMCKASHTIQADKLRDSYTEYKSHPSWLNSSWPPGASAAVPSAAVPSAQPQPQPIENLTGTARAACKALREKAFYLQMSLDSQSFLGFLHTRDCISFLQKSTLEAESNIYKQSQMLVKMLIDNITDQNDSSILDHTIEVMRNSDQGAAANNLMQHYSACQRSLPQRSLPQEAGRVDDGHQVESSAGNAQNRGRYFDQSSPLLMHLRRGGFINTNQWSLITSEGVGEQQLSMLRQALLNKIRENPSPGFLGSLTGLLSGKVPDGFLVNLVNMSANQQVPVPLHRTPAVVHPYAQPQPLQRHIINTGCGPETGQRVPGSYAAPAGFSSPVVLNPPLQQDYASVSRPVVGRERYMITERDIPGEGWGSPVSTVWRQLGNSFVLELERAEGSTPGAFERLVISMNVRDLMTDRQRADLLTRSNIRSKAEGLHSVLMRRLNACNRNLVVIQELLPDSLQRELGRLFFDALH